MKVKTIVTKTYGSNTYVFYNEDTRAGAMIDPGGEPQKLLAFLKENDITIEQILLTHGHFDHILAVHDIVEHTGASICSGEDELAMLMDPSLNLSHEVLGVDYVVKPDKLLKDGDMLSVGGASLQVISTPGHTPGGVCFLAAEQGLLFSGDTLFRESIGRADLPGGDLPTLETSIQAKLFTLPPQTVVYPGHAAQTTIQHEKQHNPHVKG